MTHFYVYVNLDDNPENATPLENVVDKITNDKLTCFILPKRILDSALWKTTNRHQQLRKMVDALGIQEKDWMTTPSWTATDNTFSVFSNTTPKALKSFTESIIRPETNVSLFVFVSGPVFRRLHHLATYSFAKFSPYLVWDRGREWPNDDKPREDMIPYERLWEGEGWAALSCRQRLRIHRQRNTEDDSISSRLNAAFMSLLPDINFAAADLVNAHDQARDEKEWRDHTHWMSPQARVAHRLLRYLPRHKERGDYGLDTEAGLLSLYGPAAWLPYQTWRHDQFDDLERDMIFESWLVPFRHHNGDWTLQPGSLLLLYWAVYVLGIWEPMPSPKAFIDDHDWHGWFGGRL